MIFITPGGLKQLADGLQWVASLTDRKEESVRIPSRDEIALGAVAVGVIWSAAWALKSAGEQIGPVIGNEIIDYIRREF